MARAYLRLDPAFFDRKAIDQKYPPGALAALIGAICHAEHQPVRGRFRDERVLKALLGPYARWVSFLISKRDLVRQRGQLYVDGWDEWQEGDWKVGERVARIRNRQKADSDVTGETVEVTAAVTPNVTVPVTVATESGDSVATVYTPSDGGRQSVIDSAGGRRKRSEVAPANPEPRETAGATLLTKRQLEAWSSFGPEWEGVKAAWLERGLRHPPSGTPEDDDTSQRGLLYQVLDARPTDLVQWIREAPGKSAADVVGHVLERWHEVRRDAGEVDETPAWLRPGAIGRAEAAESLGEILRRTSSPSRGAA